MRVSTEGLYRASLEALQGQQSRLAQVQNQIATGKRYSAAAEAPDAFAAVLRLDQRAAEMAQYRHNADQASLSLNIEELALADGQDLLQRLRELAVQGNMATLGASDRAALSQEMRAVGDALMAIANREDGNGDALFGGSLGSGPAFTRNGGVIQYQGDATPRRLEIAEGLSIAGSHPGDRVFQRLPEGNGQFTLRPGANQGNALLQVTDGAGFDGQAYTLRFNGATYDVLDGSGAVLQSGAVQADMELVVGGVSLRFQGTPDAGDRFELAPARSRDVFTMVETLASALEAPNSAARANAMAAALADLDQASEAFSSLRAEIGTRLRLIDVANDAAETSLLQLESTRSNLADADYAQAASELALRTTAYEAALQAFSRTQSLSLFSMLR